MDLAEYLRTARENGSVVLTLPWVVEFLSQMDSLASHLDTYKLAFLLLLQIYRYLFSQPSDLLSSLSAALVRNCCEDYWTY